MSNNENVSRRSRSAKDPLSREIIIKEACLLLKYQGTKKLTMRNVAKALDTGASSLYVYVKNIKELYAYVLDYSISEVILPDSQTNEDMWKVNLTSALISYHDVLYQNPGVAELAMTTSPLGKNSLALWSICLNHVLSAD